LETGGLFFHREKGDSYKEDWMAGTPGDSRVLHRGKTERIGKSAENKVREE